MVRSMGLSGFIRTTGNTPRDRAVFIAALIMGIVIWIASPLVTGTAEPWDAESPFYFVSLLGAGAVAGALGSPNKWWRWPVAIYLGQALWGAAIFIRDLLGFGSAGMNFFFPLGLIALLFSLLPSGIGAACGQLVTLVITFFARRR